MGLEGRPSGIQVPPARHHKWAGRCGDEAVLCCAVCCAITQCGNAGHSTRCGAMWLGRNKKGEASQLSHLATPSSPSLTPHATHSTSLPSVILTRHTHTLRILSASTTALRHQAAHAAYHAARCLPHWVARARLPASLTQRRAYGRAVG